MTLPPKPPKTMMPPKAIAKTPPKQFTTGKWNPGTEGQRIVIYARSGMGKTTLASMAPKPIFFGLDDGGRMIKNPLTGEILDKVQGVETFKDVRDALQQVSLFDDFKSVVIDTGTYLEQLAEPYVFRTVPHEKGHNVTNLEGYGYGKGYKHLFDTMLLVLADLDRLIRGGKNIIILCQNAAVKKANPGGEDFLEDGPKMSHPATEKNSVRLVFTEWADHVIRIDYLGMTVGKDHKAKGTTNRALFVHPETYFVAKSRTLKDPVISFDTPEDNSLWRFIFPDENT